MTAVDRLGAAILTAIDAREREVEPNGDPPNNGAPNATR